MRRHLLDSPISYLAIYYTVRCLPRRFCRWVGQGVGWLVFLFSRQDRRNLSRNFGLALNRPACHPEVQRAVRGIFSNYSRYMVDFFLFPQLRAERVRAFFSFIEGEERLRQALARGHGVLLVSAHVGNWEIGGNLLRVLGYPLTVVGLAHNTAQTNILVRHLRSLRGIEVIEVGPSTFSAVEILKALRQNRIVAMIGDRDHLGTGRPVRFLGQQIKLPPGPVILSMLSGAALMPTFVLEEPDGTYRGIIETPVVIENGRNRDAAIEGNLLRLAQVFEHYIRRHPDQWYCPDPLGSGSQPLPASSLEPV
jgi:phosphatidylinositol dimannoside acyltransferase